MSIVIPTQVEKCKGAMLGTAIGDALGWPNELLSKNKIKNTKVTGDFVKWIRSSRNPCWHNEEILPGEYSDDTQLTLSIARSIIAGDWEKFFAEKELPFWLHYERGGGRALRKAAKSCRDGHLLYQSKKDKDIKDYFDAGGNGVAMRILPHVIASAKTKDVGKLMIDIIKNTLITHGHPRAFLGATCYGYALDYLLRKDTILEYGELIHAVIDGQHEWGAGLNSEIFEQWLSIAQQNKAYDFFQEWEKTRAHMIKQLEFINISLKKGLMLDDTEVLKGLKCFAKEKGAGDVSVLAALYLASRYANNPYLGMNVAAFAFGADTDTIASMTGGLLGMLSGMGWIPIEWRLVQDYDCLNHMTELLLADNKKEATKKEVAEVNTKNNQWSNTLIGKMKLVAQKKVSNNKGDIVIIKRWKSALGQTLYTKDVQPKEIQSESNLGDSLISKKQQFNTNIPVTTQRVKSKQEDVIVEKKQKQFVLDHISIITLLDNPNFKKNITLGKVLKVINALIDNQETDMKIAQKYHVEQIFVKEIKKYIITTET